LFPGFEISPDQAFRYFRWEDGETSMKITIGTVLLLLFVTGPACSQEPDKEKPRPAQQDEPKKHQSESRAPQAQDRAHEQQNREQEKQQRDAAREQQRNTEQQQQQVRKQQEQQRDSQDRVRKEQADRNKRDAEEQREQVARQQQQIDKDRAHQQERVAQERVQQERQDARQARNVRRIREEDFHARFGRAHHFHVERRDDRRFNYGGYWFAYNEAWPADWSNYDDVYIDQVDGEYYLIDPIHPGIRIVVYVVD
jgi:hypothetical protein